MEKVGELSTSDKVLLARAMANLEQANKTFQFIGNFLTESYKLTETQAIEPNGDITEVRPLLARPDVDPDAIADISPA